MFYPKEDRPEPAPGARVRVYRNINKPEYFSILAMSGPHKGLVLGHSRCVSLSDVTFRASQATRKKVIQRQRKAVHAFADGYYACVTEAPVPEFLAQSPRRVTYHPYVREYFFDKEVPEVPVAAAKQVFLFGADCLCVGITAR